MMLIRTGDRLTSETLMNRVAVVTGAGGGIGYEAARALLWLGARVVVAEVDRKKGREAVVRLSQAFGAERVTFVQTDVGNARSVRRLKRRALRRFGHVDIVLNNATVAPLGAVQDVPIDAWDRSYRVNLRGPVLLAQAFLSDMIQRDRGVFAYVSSLGTAYMGAYESLKAAQVHLAATLDAELADTDVHAFTIGPGFVPTTTASASLPKLSALMGMPVGELQAMLKDNTLSVEAAGAGFAAAIAMADRYRGQEISSVQALIDAGIDVTDTAPQTDTAAADEPALEDLDRVLDLVRRIRTTLAEQSEGWQERNIFERQWMVRSFRSYAGRSVDAWLDLLARLEAAAAAGDIAAVRVVRAPLPALARYYAYLYDMAKGYLKDPEKREAQLQIVRSWQDDVEQLITALGGDPGA